MEAEWRLKVITDLISWILNEKRWFKVSKCIEWQCFWPLTASTTSEVKNDHSHVITQGICNKFIEVNFCVGCMVSQPNCLFQHSTSGIYWSDLQFRLTGKIYQSDIPVGIYQSDLPVGFTRRIYQLFGVPCASQYPLTMSEPASMRVASMSIKILSGYVQLHDERKRHAK